MFEKFHPLGPTSFTSRGINLSQHNHVLSESWFLLFNCNNVFNESKNNIYPGEMQQVFFDQNIVAGPVFNV